MPRDAFTAITIKRAPRRIETSTSRTSQGNIHVRFDEVVLDSEPPGKDPRRFSVMLHFQAEQFEDKVGVRRLDPLFQERAMNVAINAFLEVQDLIVAAAAMGMDPVDLQVPLEKLASAWPVRPRFSVGEPLSLEQSEIERRRKAFPEPPQESIPLSED